MFDFLSSKLSSIFSKISGRSGITEADIKSVLEQVHDALLEADVPYDLVQAFVRSVKEKVVGQKILASLKPDQQLLKVVHDSLLDFFGGKQSASFSFQLPAVVMVMGLHGSGKTTTIAKLVHWAQRQAQQRGKKRTILMASIDFYRPAAVDQLEVLSRQVDASFYRANSMSPVGAAREIYTYYKKNGYELLFLDTAGRLHVDSALLQELRDIDTDVKPRYKFLILDAMTGQESLAVARAFDQSIGFDAAILTKMDSDTRGGAAFSFRYALKKPILFVGEGEKIDNLSQFHPERAVSRILGMGDLQTLIEQTNEKIKQSEQASIQQSMASGRLTLAEFAQQMDMVSQMGSLSKLMKYMPGVSSSALSEQDIQKGEADLKRFRAIINSMTPQERLNPSILDGSRKKRVASGAGVSVEAVNSLLNRFEQAQQYVKLFKKSGPFGRLFR